MGRYGDGDFQHSFAVNVLGGGQLPLSAFAATAERAQAGFAVYRNNVLLGLVRALTVQFPTVARMLGEDAFMAVAARFVTKHPPRSPLLMTYGEGFPAFLRAVGRANSASFVADIATIELGRTSAYHAADAAPVLHSSFAAAGESLAGARIRLHPSVTLQRFATPAVTGWQANQPGSDNRLQAWHGEDALIARPQLHVGVWNLPAGAYDFLSALAGGATVADAATAAADACEAFDLAESLALMIASEIVVETG